MSLFDPTDLKAAEQRETARDRAQRIEAGRRKEEMLWLMRGPLGRRVVWRALVDGHFFDACTAVDAGQLALVAGMRARAVQLFHDAREHCPAELIEMFRENLTEAA